MDLSDAMVVSFGSGIILSPFDRVSLDTLVAHRNTEAFVIRIKAPNYLTSARLLIFRAGSTPSWDAGSPRFTF